VPCLPFASHCLLSSPRSLLASHFMRMRQRLPPDSTQGKLLAMHLKAVPALVEALGRQDIPVETKRSILCLLFSATGENDPRESSCLGEYDYLEAPWAVLGGPPGRPGSGGFAFAEPGSSFFGGVMNPEGPEQMTTVWRDWLTSRTVKIEKISEERRSPDGTGEARRCWCRCSRILFARRRR
jgi:hypothetical protein